MNKFSDTQIDKLLRDYHSHKKEDYRYKSHRTFPTLSLIAACLAVILIVGICFMPSKTSPEGISSGFMIVANAQTLDEDGIASADELSSDSYVEIKSTTKPIVEYNFDYILYEDANDFNMIQKHPFQSVYMNLHIDVVGEDIDTITYKMHSGGLNVTYCPPDTDDIRYKHIFASLGDAKTEFTMDYEERDRYQFSFTPIYLKNVEWASKSYSYLDYEEYRRTRFDNPENIVVAEDSDELYRQYGWVSSLASGYKGVPYPPMTEQELDTLRSYIKADDMVGFFNYQNKIFERLINGTLIDIIVTKTDGSTETKTVELIYTPDVVTTAEDYIKSPTRTFSTGTISAKIK